MMNNNFLTRIALLLLALAGSSSGFAQDNIDLALHQDPKHPTYYYGTFYEGTYCYTAPAGVEVWYAQSVSGGVINLEKSTDNIIYNTCGIILRSTTSSVTLTPYYHEGTLPISSVLTGTSDSSIYPDYTNYNYYVLSYTETYGVGFYKSAATTIPAHKAYYKVSKGSPGPELTVLTFDFGDEATSIASMDNRQPTTDNAIFYNLQGLKVNQPTKGIYIVNGRKVVVK